MDPDASGALHRSLPLSPAAAELVRLADACVACGLCLPVCPTYAVHRSEAHSPRGRVLLARDLGQGTLAADQSVAASFDGCLDCGSCARVCPANVDYPSLAVAARRSLRQQWPLPWRQRLLALALARPRLLACLVRCLRPVLRLLPLPAAWRTRLTVPEPRRAVDEPVAWLLPGCVGFLEHGAERALLRLTTAAGLALGRSQASCCGTWFRHVGLSAPAPAPEPPGRPVLSLSSGCRDGWQRCHGEAHLALFPWLVTFLGRWRWRAAREPVAVLLSCTARDAATREALARLLAAVPEADVHWLVPSCCGAGGSRFLDRPEQAAQLAAPVLRAAAGRRLLTVNTACELHLAGQGARGAVLSVQSVLEWLAEHLDEEVRPDV